MRLMQAEHLRGQGGVHRGGTGAGTAARIAAWHRDTSLVGVCSGSGACVLTGPNFADEKS